ncbi:MAG: DUF1080 domain-containing protein [bacterium]|nr:DUF1080 domain-containing protein [bacterium]
MRNMVVLVGLAVAMAAEAKLPDWVDIMPPEDLAGWRVLDGDWKRDGDALVGRAEAGGTARLFSEETAADFILSVEFMTPAPCAGGLHVRCHWLPETPIAEGVAPEELGRTVYGYEACIDTREPGGTGVLAEPHGRDVLAEPKARAAGSVKPGEWNRLAIWMKHERIMVKLNGKTAVKGKDTAFLQGHACLEVVGLDGGPAEIRFRNLKVIGQERRGTWRPLFDGESLEGWTEWGSEKWEVVDGAIRGTRGPKESEGYLATNEIWRDFHVRGTFKMLGAGNYGLFYHSRIKLREDGYPVISGLQGEVEPGYPGASGLVYESYKRGWLVKPDHGRAQAYLLRPDEWNEIDIECRDNRIRTWINGMRVLDHEDGGQQLFEGFFALQLHAGEGEGILWRDLYVKEKGRDADADEIEQEMDREDAE